MLSWENVTTELYWHDGNEHLFCFSWVFYQSESNKVVAGDSTLQNNVTIAEIIESIEKE
jgi:hypothetical protein